MGLFTLRGVNIFEEVSLEVNLEIYAPINKLYSTYPSP